MLKIYYADVSALGGKEILHKAWRAMLKMEVPDCVITKSKNGKPYFTNSELYFNISHSYPYVVCSFADCDVGIDIEKMRDVSKKTAQRVFTNDELELLNTGAEFLQIWTAKECVIKAAGGSIVADCKKADVSSFSECVLEGKKYYLKRVDIPECICFVATAERQNNIEIIKAEINGMHLA